MSEEAPIDHVHLFRMTLGDRALERELLQLFGLQARLLLARMSGANAPSIAALAHTIRGSACGIGAWEVARAAEAVEVAAACAGELASPLAELRAAVGRAQAAIATIICPH